MLSKDIRGAWPNLYQDLLGISFLEFPRYTISEDDPLDILIFTVASKIAYGYVAYGVQAGQSCILLAKPKVAPLTLYGWH